MRAITGNSRLQDKRFKAGSETIALIYCLSAKDFITGTNVMFLLAAIYFVAVAALGEGSEYSAVGAVLCFLAVGLVVKKDLLITGPWRAATAAFSLVIFAAQIFANVYSSSSANVYLVGSTLINGAFLVLFIGVVLTTSRDIMRKSKEEEPEEEKKESKKLTYQV